MCVKPGNSKTTCRVIDGINRVINVAIFEVIE